MSVQLNDAEPTAAKEVTKLIADGLLYVGDGYRAKNSELAKQGLPFARAGNIQGGFQFADADRFPAENLARVGVKVSAPGDVLFTSKGTVGRFAFVSEETERFVYSPQLCFWRSLEPKTIFPRYLYYWMHSYEFMSQVNAVKSQTDMADYVSLRNQRKFRITIPPLPIQTRIADILSAYDDLIENNNRRMALLEEAIHLLYREWFVYLRFPGHERVEVVDGVPEGWERTTIANLFDTSSGGTPSRSREGEFYGGSIPWIKTKELSDQWVLDSEEHITEAGLSQSSAKMFPAESIVIAMYGATIGRFGILATEACTNQACCAVLQRHGTYFGYDFAYGYFLQERAALINLGRGSAQPNVSQTVIKALAVVAPTAIVLQQYSEITKPLLQQILSFQNQNQRLREARDLLLPRLMDGRIAV